MKGLSPRYFLLVLLLVLATHLPFLSADPHIEVSISRDAFTDEGLNTSQLRNFINQGNLDPAECDNLVKTPLFNLVLALPLWIFGTKLQVARLTLLLLNLLLLAFIYKKNNSWRPVLLLFCVIGLFQYHCFQYLHFSMAESLASCCLLGAVFSFKTPDTGIGLKPALRSLFLPWVLITAAWYLKNQFIYSYALFAGAGVMLPLFQSGPKGKALLYQGIAIAMLCTAGLLFYTLAWYLPLKDVYDHIMLSQTSGRFAEGKDMWRVVRENYDRFFTSAEMYPLTCYFFGALLITPLIWYKRRSSRILLFVLLAWIVLELHKLAIYWVPSRYLLSLVWAMVAFISLVLLELTRLILTISGRGWRLTLVTIPVLLFSYILLFHIPQYYRIYEERAYTLREANRYLKEKVKKEETLLGPWAPALGWECKARVVPAWKDYLNDKNTLETFRPRAVITEFDEDETGQLFSSQGISLKELSDSSRTFHIRKRDLVIYWMRQ